MIDNSTSTLQERRRAVGLTQQRLADLADVKLSLIADVESGRQRLLGDKAERVLKALSDVEAEFKHQTAREWLVAARIEARLTQEELAKKAGIDWKDLALWEAGQKSIGDDAVMRIDDAINGMDMQKKSGTLASLVGPLTMQIAHRAQRKELDRVLDIVEERYLKEDLAKLDRLAAEVGPLKLQLAAAHKEIAKLRAKRRKK